MTTGQEIAAVLIGWNVMVFLIYGYDKLVSKTGKANLRIPERALLLQAFFAGSLGALLGMLLFRHKTRHKLFCVLVPFFLAFHLLVLGYILHH